MWQVKRTPDEFIVEEVAEHQHGDFDAEHILLWVERFGMSHEEMMRRIQKALRLKRLEIGCAGTKDTQALVRQFLTVPSRAESLIASEWQCDRLKILWSSHTKRRLKTGQLKGNKFSIRIEGIAAEQVPKIQELLEKIESVGVPNLYGTQRFANGRNVSLALECISDSTVWHRLAPQRRKMIASALQAEVFNRYMRIRSSYGLIDQVVEGDVLTTARGGLFHCTDVQVDQIRLGNREVMLTGPIFGTDYLPAEHDAAKLEQQALADVNLSVSDFSVFKKLARGTRRTLKFFPQQVGCRYVDGGTWLEFSLPKGCYATTLIDHLYEQFQKN